MYIQDAIGNIPRRKRKYISVTYVILNELHFWLFGVTGLA